MNNPLVSVVVTNYNQKDIIGRAIESVLSQTYKNIQIVVTDDGSTDCSIDLIRQYAIRYPSIIKPVFSSKNQGIPKNKNLGFRCCDGDFITYLDGDDFFFPEKTERELQIFFKNPDFQVVYSNFVYVNSFSLEKIKKWKEENVRVPQGNIFVDVFTRNFPHNTLYRNELIKSSALKAINYYDDEIKAYHDWDSRIRMSKLFKVGYSNYVGSAYVNDERGISRTKSTNFLLNEMKFVIKKNSALLKDFNLRERIFIKRKVYLKINKTRIENSGLFFKLFYSLKAIIFYGDINHFARNFAKFIDKFFAKK